MKTIVIRNVTNNSKDKHSQYQAILNDDEQGDKGEEEKFAQWAVGLYLASSQLSVAQALTTHTIHVSLFIPIVDHPEPRSVLDNNRWPVGINDFLWQTQGTGGGG